MAAPGIFFLCMKRIGNPSKPLSKAMKWNPRFDFCARRAKTLRYLPSNLKRRFRARLLGLRRICLYNGSRERITILLFLRTCALRLRTARDNRGTRSFLNILRKARISLRILRFPLRATRCTFFHFRRAARVFFGLRNFLADRYCLCARFSFWRMFFLLLRRAFNRSNSLLIRARLLLEKRFSILRWALLSPV